MDDALLVDRLQFAFTVTYHYIFPQLTMGLALLIVILKFLYVRTNDERLNIAARFWAKIFGLNFVLGVVTGIPMEFQFGTNWARFSTYAGGVIGQTLAMEGVFSFFLESTFLGLFLFGEKRLGREGHLPRRSLSSSARGFRDISLLRPSRGCSIPSVFAVGPDGSVHLTNFWGRCFNPWVGWQYAHTMAGAVVTGSFAMASVGAYYLLAEKSVEYGKLFLRIGLIAAFLRACSRRSRAATNRGRTLQYHSRRRSPRWKACSRRSGAQS